MKVHKVFPPFYNGMTEQITELTPDTYCKEMINCVPDIVTGLNRRPPMVYKKRFVKDTPQMTHFHSYDRGGKTESYIMFYTGDYDKPIKIYDTSGNEMIVQIDGNKLTTVKQYLQNAKMKALTVQDRTWLMNINKKIGLDMTQNTAPSPNYNRTAYYWLKASSGDRYNPYNYAVYLNGVSYACNPTKPSGEDPNPPKGFEDSDFAAQDLMTKINASGAFTATRVGSIIKIVKKDGGDFTFDFWDSWGSMASFGFKGEVEKMTDLPKNFHWSDTHIIVKGGGADVSKDYHVKWNGRTWEETRHPAETRGGLTNMPLIMNRTALVKGVATFVITTENWVAPKVGNTENNPDPSFVNVPLVDMFFYKNRFGIVTTDSIVFSETANYMQFYVRTVLDVIDTDPIDVAIIGEKSNEIQYIKTFDSSVYIFTSEGQYELSHAGEFSIKTVEVNRTTNYSIKIDVQPKVVSNKIFFISTANGQQRLYSYQRTDDKQLSANDLSITTPNLMTHNITNIIPVDVLGYTMCLTNSNEIYVFINKTTGNEIIQAGWVKWRILEDNIHHAINQYTFDYIGADLLMFASDNTHVYFYTMDLTDNYSDNKEDTTHGNHKLKINSKVVLPELYLKFTEIKNPNNKILLKKINVEGTGVFNARMFRKDYSKYYEKKQQFGFSDLNFHISSKVGNVELSIVDDSKHNFTITSFTLEGLYSPSSEERR